MTEAEEVTRLMESVAAVGAMLAGSTLLGIAPAHAAPVMEDDPSWNCRTMGNRICGPDNTQGAFAGQYDAQGNLVDFWPVPMPAR